MSKNNRSLTSMDIYNRDAQIAMLTMQNSILKMQLKSSQPDIESPQQQTIKDLRHPFTHEIINSFEKAFGYKVISTSAAYELDSSFRSLEHDTKTMKVTINYEGEN